MIKHLVKKLILLLQMTFLTACTQVSQKPKDSTSKLATEKHFEHIKHNAALLREFLWAMPKGGDIHHHALGAVWAEDYLEIAIKKEFFINPNTFKLYATAAVANTHEDADAVSINAFLQDSLTNKNLIIDNWSMRNHNQELVTGRDHFFSSFQKFEDAMSGHEAELLTKLCKAAASENIQYLETMVGVPGIMKQAADLTNGKDWAPGISIKDHLTDWHRYLEQRNIDSWAEYNAEVMGHWMENTNTYGVHLSFQTVGMRVLPDQAVVFSHLLLAFKTALISDHVVGVNFVAPEDDPVAIANYSTHMAMFRFLKSKYPKVSLSLHAGELNELTNDAHKDHIYEAISIAHAARIGHGFDIMQQENSTKTLALMKVKDIAVEINLETNEVILQSDSSSHPLQVYLASDIPVCLSTDDPGILRSDLTNQFILALQYVPEMNYTQLKEIIFNSIKYSFLNQGRKNQVLSELTNAFERFEFQVMTKSKRALE